MTLNIDKAPIKKILTSPAALHLFLWAFLFGLIFLSLSFRLEAMPLSSRIIHALDAIGIVLLPVYVNFYFLEKFLFRKRYGAYALQVLVLIFGYTYVFKVVSLHLFKKWFSLVDLIFNLTSMLLLTTSLKILQYSLHQRILLQESKTRQVQSELNLLKAQIHPHFLFNTLNNLFGMARKVDEATARGIAQLSHLMRYMIYDSKVEKIDLEKEIHQIHNLIALERLRFAEEDNIDITFQVEGDVKQVQIPPLLLVPLVENAFKHGISLTQASFINIHLKAQSRGIYFSVRNSVPNGKGSGEKAEGGLGLENVKRRLEILYPGSHELSVHDFGRTFHIELILNTI